MAGQSLAMCEAFGKGFQYGKRKISSMSNEEFNALNFQQLSESLATDYRVMIPSLEQSIRASDKLQSAVIQEMGDLIKLIPQNIIDFFAGQATAPPPSGRYEPTNAVYSANGITQIRRDSSGLQEQHRNQAQAQYDNFYGPDTSGMTMQEHEANKAKQAKLDAAARARTEAEAHTKAEQKAFEAVLARTGVVTSRRKATQSAIKERNRLIQQIADLSKKIPGYQAQARGMSPAPKFLTNAVTAKRSAQAKLTLILQRYIF